MFKIGNLDFRIQPGNHTKRFLFVRSLLIASTPNVFRGVIPSTPEMEYRSVPSRPRLAAFSPSRNISGRIPIPIRLLR